jgi:hypothetical protein
MPSLADSPTGNPGRRPSAGVTRPIDDLPCPAHHSPRSSACPTSRKTVTVEIEETNLRILDEDGSIINVAPRTGDKEVTRFKAYGHRSYKEA